MGSGGPPERIPGAEEAALTGRTKLAIAGAVVGFILLFVLPWWVGAAVIVLALGIPTAAYLMLDPSQRRRLRETSRRRQLGR